MEAGRLRPAWVTVVVAIVGPAAGATAQAPPATDIVLATLERADGALRVTAPVNITARPGYDNQPFFTPDGRAILYTSIRGDGQADIYRYDITRGTAARLTVTPESEYSPTPLPGGTHFSVVRVEADSAQRLWRFRMDGSAPELVLADVAPVGYHAWGDAATVALFLLGDSATPSTLRLVDLRTGDQQVVARNVGRSLHKVPGRDAVSFLQRGEAGDWIAEVDLDTRAVRRLAPALPDNEDYAWMPNGELIMGRGAKLYRWPRGSDQWEEIADLSDAGVRTISRLAVGPAGDRIAIVAVTTSEQ